jgi:hypothetical protein
MSRTVKLILAGLIGAGVIVVAGAVYVFVIAPPAVRHVIGPAVTHSPAIDPQQRAFELSGCQAAVKEVGADNITPMCKQILAGKIGD